MLLELPRLSKVNRQLEDYILDGGIESFDLSTPGNSGASSKTGGDGNKVIGCWKVGAAKA